MSERQDAAAAILILAVLILISVSMIRLGYVWGREVIQDEALEQGAAEYDSKTGLWRWKE
jgi:hypothetical protein